MVPGRRSTPISVRQPPPGSRPASSRTTRAPASAAPRPQATPPCRHRPRARQARCGGSAARQPPSTPVRRRSPAARDHRTSEGRRGIASAAVAAAGIGGGRTSAGSSAIRARPRPAGRPPRTATRARRAPRVPPARGHGTTERWAGRPPRTRTSRIARSSTSTHAVDGSGSCATRSADPRPVAPRPAAHPRPPRTPDRRT